MTDPATPEPGPSRYRRLVSQLGRGLAGRTRHVLAAGAVVLVLAGTGYAIAAKHPDPASLPAYQGTVVQYTLTPRGDVDGLILSDGTQVHLPPHLGTDLVFAVKPGDRVTVHGLKARDLPLLEAASITNDADQAIVQDTDGKKPGPGPHDDRQALQAQGVVKLPLYGPRGDLNGVLLDDGTIVRFPPHVAEQLADRLAPGQTIYAAGEGFASAMGRAFDATLIGPDEARAVRIPGGPPKKPGDHDRPPPPPAAPPAP